MATFSNILAFQSPMDRGAWQATVRGVTKSPRTERLSTHTHVTHIHMFHTHTSLVPQQLRGLRWLDGAGQIMSKG